MSAIAAQPRYRVVHNIHASFMSNIAFVGVVMRAKNGRKIIAQEFYYPGDPRTLEQLERAALTKAQALEVAQIRLDARLARRGIVRRIPRLTP